MKRLGMILAAAMLVGMAWTSSAKAAPVFFNSCAVSLAGMVGPDVVVLRISDVSATKAFTKIFVLVVSPIAKEILAVALTAISIGNLVACQVDLELTPPRLIRLQLRDVPLP